MGPIFNNLKTQEVLTSRSVLDVFRNYQTLHSVEMKTSTTETETLVIIYIKLPC